MRGAVVGMILVLGAGSAAAHDWYDQACCNVADCYPIDASDVEIVRGGWRIKATGEVYSIRPGAGQKQARVSQDGRFHRCSFQGNRKAESSICFYAPTSAF